jgi:F-type H+-transporting ATPase subunit gamma
MPSLKGIKNRINSVKNTAKITNAMKLVSAAKFSRASQAVSSARPYARAFEDLVTRLSSQTLVEHPFTAKSEESRILVVLIATDRGLCGPLNGNLLKFMNAKAQAWRSQGKTVEFFPLGRKAIEYTRKNRFTILSSLEKATDKPNIAFARKVGLAASENFLNGKYDAVYLCFAQFKSALAQEPQLTRLLPVAPAEDGSSAHSGGSTLFEPAPDQMLEALLKRRLDIQLFQALLEATASEHGSRMTAMESATRNAKEVSKKLTVQYNRARQAAITKELIEITSGASALN